MLLGKTISGCLTNKQISLLGAFVFLMFAMIYLIDKLFQNKEVMSLEEIIRKNNLDYEDIINFESGKKLIKKKD